MGFRHLIQPDFGSPEAKYGTYNFHRDRDLQQMAGLLQDQGGAVALLAGPSGSGRRYFLEAVCHAERRLALEPVGPLVPLSDSGPIPGDL